MLLNNIPLYGQTTFGLSIHLCSQENLNIKSQINCCVLPHIMSCTISGIGIMLWEHQPKPEPLAWVPSPGPLCYCFGFALLQPPLSSLVGVGRGWVGNVIAETVGCQALIWKPKQTSLPCHHPVPPKYPVLSLQARGLFPGRFLLNLSEL